MGTFSNLFEVVRDTSYQQTEEEAALEVAIALGGNSAEVRDRLHKALSRPMESLWTTNPFRLVDTNEQPTAEGSAGGLFIYALYENDRIMGERRDWLKQIAATPDVGAIVAVIPRRQTDTPERGRNLGRRLRALNPLRLVTNSTSESSTTNVPRGAGADGASYNTVNPETRPIGEVELEELQAESGNKISVVRLSGLALANLERELLPTIVKQLAGRELALAKRAPIFRNAVASHFIYKTARSNAEMVLLANVTSGLPFLSGFFGGGADFVLLTKNQFELSHRLASVYGQKRSSWVELYLELVPIVAGAFIWRNISRTVTAQVPKILGIVPKAAIAYASTLGVGKLAQLYYANGRKGPAELANLARSLFEQVTGQARAKTNADGQSDKPPRRLRFS